MTNQRALRPSCPGSWRDAGLACSPGGGGGGGGHDRGHHLLDRLAHGLRCPVALGDLRRGWPLAPVGDDDPQSRVQDRVTYRGRVTDDDAPRLAPVLLTCQAHLVPQGELDQVRAPSPASTWAAGADNRPLASSVTSRRSS